MVPSCESKLLGRVLFIHIYSLLCCSYALVVCVSKSEDCRDSYAERRELSVNKLFSSGLVSVPCPG